MADVLFSYVPRTTSRILWWLPLVAAGLISAGVVRVSNGAATGAANAVLVVAWISCSLLALLLRWAGKHATRNNVIRIESDGVLTGSFGGWKIQTGLATVRKLELLRDRSMTKIWIEPRDGGRRRLVMAFFGEMSADEKSRFQAAVSTFGTECVIA